jgi:hypothetical protein
MVINADGKKSAHHAKAAIDCASETINPSEAFGGWVPSPKKLKPDSVKIAQESESATCTTIGAVTLGKI